MPYTDFEYYQKEFGGTCVPSEEEYRSASLKAGCYLDWLTNGRMKTGGAPEEAKLAECAVSELYWESGRRMGIRSESNDGFGVEFSEPEEAEMYRTAGRYLPPSLIYRGIGI